MASKSPPSPLEDTQIIDEICKFLPFKDLVKYRLLNSKWSESCVRLLRIIKSKEEGGPSINLDPNKRFGLDFDTSKAKLWDVVDRGRECVVLFGISSVHSIRLTLVPPPSPFSPKQRKKLLDQVEELARGTDLRELRIVVDKRGGWKLVDTIRILRAVASVKRLTIFTVWPEQPLSLPSAQLNTVEWLVLGAGPRGQCFTTLRGTMWPDLRCLTLHWRPEQKTQAQKGRGRPSAEVYPFDEEEGGWEVVLREFIRQGCPRLECCIMEVTSSDQSLLPKFQAQVTSIQASIPRVEFEMHLDSSGIAKIDCYGD